MCLYSRSTSPTRCIIVTDTTSRVMPFVAFHYVAIKFAQPFEVATTAAALDDMGCLPIYLCARGWPIGGILWLFVPNVIAAASSKLRKIRPKFDGNPLPTNQPILLRDINLLSCHLIFIITNACTTAYESPPTKVYLFTLQLQTHPKLGVCPKLGVTTCNRKM